MKSFHILIITQWLSNITQLEGGLSRGKSDFARKRQSQMVCCMGGRAPVEGEKEPELDFILVFFIYLGYSRLI